MIHGNEVVATGGVLQALRQPQLTYLDILDVDLWEAGLQHLHQLAGLQDLELELICAAKWGEELRAPGA